MTSSVSKLVYMANQIATAFRRQAPEKAVAATHDHFVRFWDPRMRQLIVAEAANPGLNAVARAAVERLVAGIPPVTATSATNFRPGPDGEMTSDAG